MCQSGCVQREMPKKRPQWILDVGLELKGGLSLRCNAGQRLSQFWGRNFQDGMVEKGPSKTRKLGVEMTVKRQQRV